MTLSRDVANPVPDFRRIGHVLSLMTFPAKSIWLYMAGNDSHSDSLRLHGSEGELVGLKDWKHYPSFEAVRACLTPASLVDTANKTTNPYDLSRDFDTVRDMGSTNSDELLKWLYMTGQISLSQINEADASLHQMPMTFKKAFFGDK